MSREKQKPTRKEKIETAKADLERMSKRQTEIERAIAVDVRRKELSENILALKLSNNKVDTISGRPAYMMMQEFWDMSSEMERLINESINKPYMDNQISMAETDLNGIIVAIKHTKKELEGLEK